MLIVVKFVCIKSKKLEEKFGDGGFVMFAVSFDFLHIVGKVTKGAVGLREFVR